MSVVTFNPAQFYAQFPELSSVSTPLLQSYFAMASSGLIDNTDCSRIPDVPAQGGLRTQVLLLATAHIARLFGTINGAAPAGLVGRISTATEGSVTVGVELKLQSESAAYWSQTSYGLLAWQMLKPYRTALWVGGRVRNMNPYAPGIPRGNGP